MKLFFLLTLVFGGFSLPAHASKLKAQCIAAYSDHKLMQSNSGLYIIRRTVDGEIRETSTDRAAMETIMFDNYCKGGRNGNNGGLQRVY